MIAGDEPSHHATLAALRSGTSGHDLFSQHSLADHERRLKANAVRPVVVVEAAPERQRPRAVVSAGDLVARLVLWSPRWDMDALRDLCRRVDEGPDGRRLIFVEPLSATGWRRVVQRAMSGYWVRRLGHNFDRDLPVDLRHAGFMINTLDRFSLGPLGLWTYAYGEAVVKASEPLDAELD